MIRRNKNDKRMNNKIRINQSSGEKMINMI